MSDQGNGRILGTPGIYHLPHHHGFVPSRFYGNGGKTWALCDRAEGIVYSEDTLANLFPGDRLCKFCERKAQA